MATLRNNLPLFRQPTVSLRDMENYDAQQMGDLRRGWEAGRIGTEANSALSDLATARANEDVAAAAELEARVKGLRGRQGMYTPEVDRLEKIDSVGSAIDWAQGAMGQGAASMVEPIAAGAGTAALGTALGFIPNPVAKGVGALLRGPGAFAAPYAINQDQLKGEFYGQAIEDPTIMQNYTAQQLNQRANLQGAGAAALDSIVPGIIGRGLGGAGLRAGIDKMGVGAKTLGGMAMEGTTELGQGELTRWGLQDMNPNRPVSPNVNWDRANEFAAGAIGAGPFTAAGAVADAGFRRTGAMASGTADFVKEKAGQVVDMYDGSSVQAGVDKAVDAGKGLFRKGKETVIDMKDGKVTAKDIAASLKERTSGVFDSMEQAMEERSILSGDSMGAIDPNDADYDSKFLAEEDRRSNLIADKLEKMAADDPKAAELFNRAFASGASRADQMTAIDEAAEYVLQKSNIETLINKAERGASTAGKVAGYAGKIAGRVGKTAWDAAVGAAKGFNEGRKQNQQTWTEGDVDSEFANRKQMGEQALSLERAKNFAAYLEDGVRSREEQFKAVKRGVDTDRLAKYMGDIGFEIADLADQWAPLMEQRPKAEKEGGTKKPAAVASGPQSLLQSDAPNFEALTLSLNRIANDLNSAFGKDASAELTNIQGMAAPGSEPFFEYLQEQIALVQSKGGARATAEIRRQAQNEIVRAFDPATTNKLLNAGINIYKPEGKRALLGMVEAIYTGRAAAGFDKELAKIIGQDTLDGMLQAVDTQTQQFAAQYIDDADVIAGENGLEMTEDGDIVESGTRQKSMIEKQGERAVEKGAGGKMYGFFGMDKPRTDKNRDPFKSDERVTAAQLKAWDDHVLERKAEGMEPDWDNDPRAKGRPRLIPAGQSDRAVRLMEERLKVDRTPERMLTLLKEEGNEKAAAAVEKRMAAAKAGDEQAQAWLDERVEPFFLTRAGSWRVSSKTAADVMRERGMTERAQVLSMYRDYMRQEAARNEKAAATSRGNKSSAEVVAGYEEKAKAANYEAKVAGQALLDAMDQAKTKSDGVARKNRLGPEVRKQAFDRAREYFEQNEVVVAERLSDRDPNVLSAEDILTLNDQGRRTFDLAKKDGPKILNQAGILTFDSDLTAATKSQNNKAGDGKVHIPASKLVYLARERRMLSQPLDFEDTSAKFSNKDKNKQYLEDLMDGIAMMIASGHVQGLPVAYDKEGKAQSFKQGIPNDLMLATSTFGAMNFGKKKNAKSGYGTGSDNLSVEFFEELRQKRVTSDVFRGKPEPRTTGLRAEEELLRQLTPAKRLNEADAAQFKTLYDATQNATTAVARAAANKALSNFRAAMDNKYGPLELGGREDDTDNFVADARTDQEPSGYKTSLTAPRGKQFNLPQVAVFGNLNNTAVRGEEGGGEYKERRITDNRTDRKPHTATTQTDAGQARMSRSKIKSEDNATPLDFFEKQKPDDIRDEFAEQRRQSIMEGKVSSGVKSMAFKKGRMDVDGVAQGRILSSELQNDPTTGMDRLTDWMRMAARPDFDGKGGVVGGLHLAMPAAVALNKDTMATYDPDNLQELVSMRKDLARIIRDSDAKPAVKVALLKAMAPAAQASKINAVNVKSMLAAIDGEAPNLGRMDVGTRTKAEINAASDKALAEYQAKMKTPAPAKEAGAPVGKPQAGTGSVERKLNAQASGTEYASLDDIAEEGDNADSPWLMADGRILRTFGDHMVAFGENDTSYSDFMRRTGAIRAAFFHDSVEKSFVAMLHRYEGQQFTPAQAETLRYLNGKQNGKMVFLEGAKDGQHNPEYVPTDLGTIEKNVAAPARLNAQNDPSRPATDAEIKAAKDFIRKVLGPQIKVDFKDITGYAGEWIDAKNTIEIAMASAPGAMQVAYHEAFHAFFSKFAEKNPEVRRVLQELVMDPVLNERILALLDGFPAAQEQFKNSAEERLAYAFQFWNAGKLDLPHEKAKTLFQKLKEFFRRVFGRVTDSERAVAILEAFREGKLAGEPSVAGQVIAKSLEKGTWTTKQARKMDGALQKVRSLVLPSQSILASSDSATARSLSTMFWTNPADEDHSGLPEGYLNSRLRHATQYKNKFNEAIAGLTSRDINEIADVLLQEQDNLNDIAYAPQRDAAKKIRSLIQRFRTYMVDERGLEMGDRGPFYFPRVWNPDTLFGKADEFKGMLLSKYDHILEAGVQASKNQLTKEEVAQRILNALLTEGVSDSHMGPQREDGVLAPFFGQKEIRNLAWLDSADAAPYLEKNIVTTLTQYFHNGARAAEYASRFGNRGEKLDSMLKTVELELDRAAKHKVHSGEIKNEEDAAKWVERQLHQVHIAVGAMEGTLGKDISSLWRETSAWTTVYQNIRLLPLTLFASVVDPLGVLARGGTMSDAASAFARGMKEVYRSWKNMASDNPDDRAADKWEQLARDAGIIDAAMFAHFVSDEYSSVYMSKKAKRVNDVFFQANGMEGWNRGMRAGATKAAVLFLQRHKGLPDVHSKRWLNELNLTPDDIALDDNGELITNWRVYADKTGATKEVAQAHIAKIHYALSRWVQGAVLTPNAAQRPGWSSDPHWSMFFHLKQFAYSFHQTILKRAVRELDHGNLAPIGAFMWYVPVMIASDITKGIIQGGGELPPHMARMDAGEWVLHGVERAGLLGVGTIGVDAGQDIFSLGGPMVEQIIDGFSQPLNEMTLKALPAHPVYKNWVE